MLYGQITTASFTEIWWEITIYSVSGASRPPKTSKFGWYNLSEGLVTRYELLGASLYRVPLRVTWINGRNRTVNKDRGKDPRSDMSYGELRPTISLMPFAVLSFYPTSGRWQTKQAVSMAAWSPQWADDRFYVNPVSDWVHVQEQFFEQLLSLVLAVTSILVMTDNRLFSVWEEGIRR